MARPKKGDGTPATKRLENAFWELLDEGPYSEITIAKISNRANVNHNTFYYYYDSLNDMAERLMTENLLADLPAQIISALAEGTFASSELINNDEVRLRFKRACLLAGPRSTPWMLDRLQKAVMDVWLSTAHLDENMLDHDDQVNICFIFGGIIAIIGKYGHDGDLDIFRSVASGPLGKSFVEVMEQLATKAKNPA